MDKVVDHLLVFKGEGEIKDFPGNYSQYREWNKLQTKEEADKKTATTKQTNGDIKKSKAAAYRNDTRRRMTYKERIELQQLEKDIEALCTEKEQIEQELSSGTIAVERITELSKRLPVITDELDTKEMRWLELSEIEG